MASVTTRATACIPAWVPAGLPSPASIVRSALIAASSSVPFLGARSGKIWYRLKTKNVRHSMADTRQRVFAYYFVQLFPNMHENNKNCIQRCSPWPHPLDLPMTFMPTSQNAVLILTACDFYGLILPRILFCRYIAHPKMKTDKNLSLFLYQCTFTIHGSKVRRQWMTKPG